VPSDEVTFACGGPLGEDQKPASVTGARGSTQRITFYYRAPGRGLGDQRDQIQGLSMAIRFSCDFTASVPADHLAGGALAETMAEFVHIEIDNRRISDDGDRCEFTAGVLVDAVAPFDGRTLPATSVFRKLFDLEFLIEDGADCGDCLSLNYRNELSANDERPVSNLVSINFQSRRPETCDCDLCVAGDPQFQRGDCNFSGGGRSAVDIADAAAMVGFFFLQGAQRFAAPCEDACDANDDGRLDAADVIFILEFMFVPNKPQPPDPGPNRAGSDPTPDSLGCVGGPLSCS
jgi:hypothetical protein